MSYTSIYFAIFIVGLFILYFILPKKVRWVSLLAGSYVFYYYAAGIEAVGLILFTSAVVFVMALILGSIHSHYKILSDKAKVLRENDDTGIQEKNIKKYKHRSLIWRRLVMTFGIIYVFGILAYVKYSNFLIDIINDFSDSDFTPINLLLPLGISFYSFQLAGYLIDIYRGKYGPDKNIFKFMLFSSFFPQIVQGPISRYDQLASQLYEGHKFDYTRIKFGVMLIIWGYFKKLVIADRAAVIVATVISNPTDYFGLEVAFSGVAYMIQIYADFSGGIDISIGIAQIFGITLVQNFRQPYFSTSLNEYWRRWHITLGAWTRDYIFFSMSLSKPAAKFTKATRKFLGSYLAKTLPSCFAMGVVFLVIGIWHGAAWQYVAFALYNAVIIMFEILVIPPVSKLNDKLHLVNTKVFSWKIVTICITLFIVFIGKFFTMSHGLAECLILLENMFTVFNPEVLFDGSLYELGLNNRNIMLLFASVVMLFIVDLLKENGIQIRERFDHQNLVIKTMIYLIAIFSIIIFGIYGAEVVKETFIYQQF